jgi:multidrug efflux pump subunit AcrA (membrane-fusion protein)
MRTTGLVLSVLLASLSCFGQQLSTDDRLLVREAQLQLAQAHIALAQAQANVAKAEASLTQLIMSLQGQYKCAGCTLNQDLRFSPPPKEEKPTATAAGPDAKGVEVKKEQREKTK